ncbi:UMP-CMP kinase [Plasmodium yoelii]|uniref:Ump-cmp kinase n=3 Tax=Plasmodium yoelii TaxID=5861 RepID=Q7RD30_PLAYO|nr:UMP-CMP kinase [Plasmodium yoelii]EAA17639.1 ump-cmp kinase [Plasmodium yoelii yoelii]CDU16051.1 UMP-CMP kinase, putative [Plasmodium yoelii]VTZ71675.1 UMP-CMP kinase, putative [Plasmodium yoelii]|eukprot:XP_726074.1 UMP-CMP kinase [Plasmodium yoelii]
MNIKKIFIKIFFMATVIFSHFITQNICYSNKKKHIFFLNRTNVYNNNNLVYTLKNTHWKNNIRRAKIFNKLFFENNLFYINKSIEQKFFANNIFKMDMHQPFVIFMLGGPGSGKGTQCKLIQENFDFVHISAGDCLREYLIKCEKNEADSKYKEIVEDSINNGKIAPAEITIELMKHKMEDEINRIRKNEEKYDNEDVEKLNSFSFNSLDDKINLENTNINENSNKLKYENNIYENNYVLDILKKNKILKKAKYKFIIDGFPRNYNNLNGWINIIKNYAYVHLCIFLYCDEDHMIKRCINRGLISGRVDDNINTLKKRFETHNKGCIPIINLFLSENKCIFINANKTIEGVWNDMKYVFENM